MPIVIRSATDNDAAAIAQLNTHVQSIHADAHPWRFKQPSDMSPTAADIAAIIAQANYFAFIADIAGTPVGYLTGEIVLRAESPFHHAHDSVHLHHISVDPRARRQGVARSLMDAAKARGAEAGISLMTLDVWDFNAAARAFFASYGLVPSYQRLWNRKD